MLEHVPVTPIESADLAAETADSPIRHGFFTRAGGVSEGIYSGLNVGLGSNDETQRITENRARVCRWFGVADENLATLYQVHSPDVVVATGPMEGERPKADGIVTDRPNVVIGILTADCGPILFADRQAGVIGAAHAGWRGALEGVAENTIDAMVALGARRESITAVLGPSISQDNYEVGPEFVERFVARDPGYADWFRASERPEHAMFDLQGFTVDRLAKAGVRAASTGHCTYADEEKYFSFRRTTHRREPDYGRQISAIVIKE